MAGIGHRHRLLVLVASPGASLQRRVGALKMRPDATRVNQKGRRASGVHCQTQSSACAAFCASVTRYTFERSARIFCISCFSSSDTSRPVNCLNSLAKSSASGWLNNGHGRVCVVMGPLVRSAAMASMWSRHSRSAFCLNNCLMPFASVAALGFLIAAMAVAT